MDVRHFKEAGCYDTLPLGGGESRDRQVPGAHWPASLVESKSSPGSVGDPVSKVRWRLYMNFI